MCDLAYGNILSQLEGEKQHHLNLFALKIIAVNKKKTSIKRATHCKLRNFKSIYQFRYIPASK